MNRSPARGVDVVKHVGIAAVAVAIVVIVSPGIGTQPISVIEAWRHWPDDSSAVHHIAFDLRLPRAVTALVAGATLALAGGVFQTLFRNPLATPYTLGIASAGSLGALIGLKMGLAGTLLGLPQYSWCALLTSAMVVGLIFLLAGTTYRLSGNALVLAGVTIGLFCGAMMMFVTYVSDVRETFAIVRWMMGSLEKYGYGEITGIIGPLIVSWTVLIACAGRLNQFEMGDELAASRGVNLFRLHLATIGFASLATACIVSVCGPIGFVGLIVPHAARLVIGRDHRVLLPAVALWGAVFLVVCDWFSVLAPVWAGRWTGMESTAAPLPIGVVTALVGAPLFLVLLGRSRRVE
ncbi:MAG: iron ABC transporter permease [Phycisphaerales bacterium]|nr:iron ABC transporter permease [Phycisphaerales bacterium]